jgi:hypothetical protein
LNAIVRLRDLVKGTGGGAAVLLAANGVAALPFADAYRTCVAGWTSDGQIWRADVDQSTRVVPFLLRCSYRNGVAETHGPSAGALLAWASVLLLMAVAIFVHRGAPVARGLAGSAGVLALYGYLTVPLAFDIGSEGAAVVGVPLVYAIDRGLRVQTGERMQSVVVAIVLPIVVLLCWFVGWCVELNTAGALFAMLAGAGAASLVHSKHVGNALRPVRGFLVDSP